MKLEKINSWIQAVGMFAVVASLVFVGLQLRQSQKIAIASQYQDRLDAASTHYTSILQSDHALRVIGRDVLADLHADPNLPQEFKTWASEQPPEEIAFRVIGSTLFLKSHDNVHFQYQQGFISEEAWIGLREQLKVGLLDQRTWTASVYLDNKQIWRDSYQELIDEILKEG